MEDRRKVMTLNFRGMDNWDRPVYECDGRLYVDVDTRETFAPNVCTKCNNEFDGEPDSPISGDVELVFVPERIVWR